jgi:hypothetical protein
MWIMTKDGWQMIGPREYVAAPRSGIFRPDTIEHARAENAKRVQAYAMGVAEYVASDDGKAELSMIYHGWHAPLFGAFGETIR